MQAIGQILPIALAVALSTLPILLTVMILLGPTRSKAAIPYLIGWVLGIVLVVVAFAFATQFVPASRSPRRPDTTIAILEILVGTALIVLALIGMRRKRADPQAQLPSWLNSERGLGPWQSFGIAFALNLRPKALLLAFAAGLTIRADAPSSTEALVAIGIYTIIGSSTVVAPIIATLAAPDRMEPRLTSMRTWLIEKDRAMRGIILISSASSSSAWASRDCDGGRSLSLVDDLGVTFAKRHESTSPTSRSPRDSSRVQSVTSSTTTNGALVR